MALGHRIDCDCEACQCEYDRWFGKREELESPSFVAKGGEAVAPVVEEPF